MDERKVNKTEHEHSAPVCFFINSLCADAKRSRMRTEMLANVNDVGGKREEFNANGT